MTRGGLLVLLTLTACAGAPAAPSRPATVATQEQYVVARVEEASYEVSFVGSQMEERAMRLTLRRVGGEMEAELVSLGSADGELSFIGSAEPAGPDGAFSLALAGFGADSSSPVVLRLVARPHDGGLAGSGVVDAGGEVHELEFVAQPVTGPAGQPRPAEASCGDPLWRHDSQYVLPDGAHTKTTLRRQRCTVQTGS
jgi:hypothetical protein